VSSFCFLVSSGKMERRHRPEEGVSFLRQRAESPLSTCPSIKSDLSKGLPPEFSEPGPSENPLLNLWKGNEGNENVYKYPADCHRERKRAESPTPTCPSMNSDLSKGLPPEFSEPGPSDTKNPLLKIWKEGMEMYANILLAAAKKSKET
ncbi:hypothetical protein L3Q82_011386, partial [Scortum barcoo]